jgi:hypothetical protein
VGVVFRPHSMIKKRRTLCAKHWTSKLPEGVTISAAAGLAMILASLYQSMARAAGLDW